MAVRQQSDLRLYLDILPDPSKVGVYLVHRNVTSLTFTLEENTVG